MYLGRIEIHNLRILTEVSLSLCDAVNVFVGPNGSGKSSVLEGIHLLGLGRSFRSRSARDVVQRGRERTWVRGEVGVQGEDGIRSLGVEWGGGGLRIRCQGQDIRSASALARELPLVFISPDSGRLLTDGASLRRGLIDWAMFHVEPGYGPLHQRYRRALRQRNSSLRDPGAASQMDAWNQELAEAGEAVEAARARYLGEIIPGIGKVVTRLLPCPVEITYQRGWPREETLAGALSRGLEHDRAMGFTRAGPHRADLGFHIAGARARDVLSRGESKLFVMGVMLAQADYLAAVTGKAPAVLVDELASELDEGGRARVFAEIEGIGCQSFVTAVSKSLVEACGPNARVFHVEQGRVCEVI